MKKSLGLISLCLVFVTSLFAQQEVLIVGTMHGVYGLAKKSYRPMLKKAKAYQPDAIYVERIPAWDTLSMKDYYAGFLACADTLSQKLSLDENEVKTAQQKTLDQMTEADFKLLYQHYQLSLDYANMQLYSNLVSYGLDGKRKLRGHEMTDVSIPLAIEMGMTKLYSMDFQQYFKDYGKAWRACEKNDKESKDKGAKRIKRQLIRLSIEEGLNGAFGSLGKYTNREKTVREYHELNSFRYRETSCKPCEDGTMYWDLRNLEMARNIGNQVQEHRHQKSVVVVGAGHVVGLQEALAKEFPDIKVRLYREL